MGTTSWTCGWYEATLAIKNDERVRPTEDTSGKSNGVAGEGDGAIMNVGSGRDEEGSSSEEESDEEMVADAQEGEYVEPSAVAEDEPDRAQEDLHGDEEAPTRNVRNPKHPLPEERDLHYKRGHSPYRAWGPVCVKARGGEDQHKAKESDEQAVVNVSMDYCSVGEMKLLVGREDKSKHEFCHLCKCKGLKDDRIVDKIMRRRHGGTRRLYPALVQVQDRIIRVRTQPTIPENPPAYDPQANGGAERGVQEVKVQ